MKLQTHAGIRFGSPTGLPPASLPGLAERLNRPAAHAADAMRGRVAPDFVESPELGPLVIKHYVRGGWIRHFNRRGHLWNRASRGRREFEMLEHLRQLGFAVPRAVAWAERGRFLIHAWLILAEQPGVQTLAALAQADTGRARAVLPQTTDAVARLVAAGIHHVDLHPGNVLIDDDNQVYLIDFDKAVPQAEPGPGLAERYRRRWHRAVEKHGLPGFLGEGFDPAARLVLRGLMALLACLWLHEGLDPAFLLAGRSA